MKDIFEFRKQLIGNYTKFSTSFSSPCSPDIAAKVKEAYDNGKFWPDPLIQINPNYRKGGTVTQLVEMGDLEPETADIFQAGKEDSPPNPIPITLYSHQSQAISMVKGKKSYVVTTGTGSGKSLAFFIPIVNQIIREKKTDPTKRIRAIIVYPMNALANSQFEEIQKFLHGSDLVSVKRYTGQENTAERADIKSNPPDILLTNYVMLDLILTRYSEDHEIVEAAQNLEFLVLDELHTYRGRQGADVAMLVRRIRVQLNANNLLCIGTSATMASVGSTEDRQQAVATVASKIFDTQIDKGQIILEELEYVTNPCKIPELKAALPARIKKPSTWSNLDDFKADPLAIWIERNLGIVSNKDGKLERAKPLTLGDAAKKLSSDSGCTEIEAENALHQFLVNLYTKQDWDNNRAPFAFKLHQFISGPSQVMTTLESPNKRLIELDVQRFAPGREKGQRLFATYFCRFCGQEYIPVWFTTGASGSIESVEPRDITDNAKCKDGNKSILPGFLCPIESLPNESVFPCSYETSSDEIKEYLPDEWFTINPRGERVLSDTSKGRIPRPLRIRPDGIVSSSNEGTPYWLLPGPHTWCLNCGQTHNGAGRDSNRLVGLSGEGRSTATTILTMSALNLMYASHDGINKLLGFTDNRQDAALQSGHFNEFVLAVTLRSALLRALINAPEQQIESSEIAQAVFAALGFDTQDPEILSEYLENPDLRGGALLATQKALRFMLGYRLHADLSREWRFNNPNLEQLRLIKIKYNWMDDLINSPRLNDSKVLASLSPEKRRLFAELVFDHLRKSLCIESDYFKPEEQERILKGNNKNLLEAWQLPSDNSRLVFAKNLYLFKSRDEDLSQNEVTCSAARQLKKHEAVSGSFSSRLFKLLVKGHCGSNKSLWTNTEWTAPQGTSFIKQTDEQRNLLFDALSTLLVVANDFGIVSTSPIGSAQHPVFKCRLDAASVLWALNKGSAATDPNAPARSDGSIRNSFFQDLYLQTAATMDGENKRINLYESHEHTAQVEPELREMLEMRFRNKAKDQKDFADKYPEQRFKPLPVLYCSPTMELGVDISTLDMVYMRNVPPTPANYAQRSGRAGRSGQAALVVTYCTSLSPHDQWFFQRIVDMVHGEVRVPSLDLTNRDLIDSHLRAIWLSCVKKDLPVNISELLEMTQQGLPLKPDILEAFRAPDTLTAAKKLSHLILSQLAEREYKQNLPYWYTSTYEDKVIDEAPAIFDKSLNRWRTLFESTNAQIEKASKIITNAAASPKERDDAARIVQDAKNQINVLLCKSDQGRSSTKNRDFYLYRYLASEGVLPGYSFPRLPVTAWIPNVRSTGGRTRTAEMGMGTIISRPRFLALSEFGPQSLIYHEGHTFRVYRVKLRAADLTGGAGGVPTIGTRKVRICEKCGYAQFESPDSIGVSNCPHCNAPLTSEQAIPNLYQVNAVEARRKDRISLMDEERERRGYDLRTVYSFETNHTPTQVSITHDGAQLATLTYAPTAKISRINLGWRRRKDENEYGFWMIPSTGEWTTRDDPEDDPQPDGNGVREATQKIVPYVEDHRNALILTPPDELVGDNEAIITLIAALQRGIEHVFQVESSEIAAEPVPSNSKPQKILIYEASEGGAGVLNRLALDPHCAQIFAALARAALEVMHYSYDETKQDWVEQPNTKCVAGCYKCLLSYYNQPQHECINRRNPKVLQYLKQLTRLTSTDFQTVSSPSLSTPLPSWAIGATSINEKTCTITFPSEPSPEVRNACEDKGYEVVIK
jgi:superfamily II DNA/RNA helicase